MNMDQAGGGGAEDLKPVMGRQIYNVSFLEEDEVFLREEICDLCFK